jgi:hypothetical protein
MGCGGSKPNESNSPGRKEVARVAPAESGIYFGINTYFLDLKISTSDFVASRKGKVTEHYSFLNRLGVGITL